MESKTTFWGIWFSSHPVSSSTLIIAIVAAILLGLGIAAIVISKMILKSNAIGNDTPEIDDYTSNSFAFGFFESSTGSSFLVDPSLMQPKVNDNYTTRDEY